MSFDYQQKQGIVDAAKAKVKRFVFRAVIPLTILGFILVTLPMTMGVNDAGHRTVVQWPNGNLFVKFEPGFYIQAFGKITEYNDVVTYDFDATQNASGAILDYPGIPVRYRDGGMGTIYGKSRFTLPTDEATMLILHKETRSNQGVANKIIKSVTDEAINQTAGLMTSEEGYDAKRAIFTQQAREQLTGGLYKTRVQTKIEKDEVTGKTVSKQYPVPVTGEDGKVKQYQSDLKKYGITVSGFQLNNPGFEKTTMAQIAEKRKATMAIITAKATAEKAKQDAITAEEQGKANVMAARYVKEVEKQQAVVDAEKAKEVATIKAEQKVDVAKQSRLEAEQKKFAAQEYKQEQILIGEGESERKRLVLEADGALEQKLATYERVMRSAFTELGKQKWVPEIQFGASTEGETGSSVDQFIQLLGVKAAKDINLDMTIPAQK